MSIDLGDLVGSLKREVATPGTEDTLFPNVDDTVWAEWLSDGFWDARLDGMLKSFTEADGVVTPVTGTVDMSRDLQQLVVIYAGTRIMRNELREINTTFRTAAGPVQFETGKSAQLLVAILNDFANRKKILLTRLSDLGIVDTFYIDAVIERDFAIDAGLTSFTR